MVYAALGTFTKFDGVYAIVVFPFNISQWSWRQPDNIHLLV